ncbi:ATP synthase F0 subunit B [bacterium C-53]|nr:ATP synthase F0 subunit B [Lachnospiraceae bacterium]NBI04298.1 ATP synthase F0 subunit B [Lachnospiraceae bacterium]RKJ08468.1 ATP synthase F0 subunit B [bacterium C-53]
MERLFDLDFQLIHDAVLTLISVFVLVLVASYCLFNPVREFLNKRREGIKNDLDTAAKDKEDAAALKAEYEQKLGGINKEAEEILAEARKKAVANETKIVNEAKAEAARIIERAHVEAELEKKKAVDDMKQEIISVASMMAGKVVAASMNTEIQNTLVDETLKEMGDRTWLS